PIQLAIFLRLSELAKQSIWVGDPKQSIYGFRGAEPALMAAVIRHAGGIQPENIQPYSWRSREDLVYVANAIFTRAFNDIPVEEVRLIPRRTRAGKEDDLGNIPPESDAQAATNGLLHWHYELDGKGRTSAAWLNDVVAISIKELLANPPDIRPKDSTSYRPLQAADLAILCRSNYACADMARALKKAGIPAAVARTGLTTTAECVLILACMKYILSAEDSLSAAEIMLLASRKPLANIVDNRLDYLAAAEKAEQRYALPNWGQDDPFISRLDIIREDTREFSPAELLNYLLEQLDVRRIVVAWGDGEQRLSNLDALRKLSLVYEDNCHQQQQAASMGGFLLYLARLHREQLDKQGASERPEAVNVLTYHRSKGLEWPMVICHNLEQKLRADLWGLNIISETTDIDPTQPLANRWLRYWANPYGRNTANLALLEALQQSEWQQYKTKEARAEEARLLYVGITRARDYLVFPTTKAGAPWLDRVYESGKDPVLDPFHDSTPFVWQKHEIDKTTQTWIQPKALTTAELDYQPILFLAGERPGPGLHQPLYLNEEEVASELSPGPLQPSPFINYQPAYQLLPSLYSNEYGQAVTAFFQADVPSRQRTKRVAMAQGLLDRFGIEDSSADELLDKSTAFYQHMEQYEQGLNAATAISLHVQHGQQLYDITADILLKGNKEKILLLGLLIPSAKWKKKVDTFMPAYALRAAAFAKYYPGGISRAFIHFPIQGVVTELPITPAL
ncbi:MAG: 3'-5' exonuclease, partial [Bacteroidota bacterium]